MDIVQIVLRFSEDIVWRGGNSDAVGMGAFRAATCEIHKNGVVFADGAFFLRNEQGGETDLRGFVQINAFYILEKFSCLSSLFI